MFDSVCAPLPLNVFKIILLDVKIVDSQRAVPLFDFRNTPHPVLDVVRNKPIKQLFERYL